MFEQFPKKGFSAAPGLPLLSFPSLLGDDTVSSAAIPAPVQHRDVRRDARRRDKSAQRAKELPDIKNCCPFTIVNAGRGFFFFPCGRAGQFSPNCWAVWWSGRNSTAITRSLVSCVIIEGFGGEVTKLDTFDQTFPVPGRSFQPEHDMPHYGGNNNNFPPPVSGLIPQKTPAHWYQGGTWRATASPRLSGSSHRWKLFGTPLLSLFHLLIEFLISSC